MFTHYHYHPNRPEQAVLEPENAGLSVAVAACAGLLFLGSVAGWLGVSRAAGSDFGGDWPNGPLPPPAARNSRTSRLWPKPKVFGHVPVSNFLCPHATGRPCCLAWPVRRLP
jgi:hypothetical protein